jgi:hypothetical protein
VELRVDGDVAGLLSFLRSRGAAGDDAFAVGATVTIPLRGAAPRDVIEAADDFGTVAATTTRRPTLDDVYLRLTGSRLAA